MIADDIAKFPVGAVVTVVGYEECGTRRIVEHLDQQRYPGGVVLDERVDLFRWWNVDALQLKEEL